MKAKKALAVIGMNYGDEGKGHITNYLSDPDTLVIRFNGGAQAAHSVFIRNGKNHVFHHFGSGSLKGARTLLASHFIFNPLVLANELWDLSAKVSMREIFVDPRCRVSTHYDMLINSFNSTYKKSNDTCGLGINETVERSKYRQLLITTKDLIEKKDDELIKILNTIEKEYIPFRIEALKLPKDEFDKFSKDILKKDNYKPFMELRRWLISRKPIVVYPEDKLIDKFLSKGLQRKIIFEGAQGMLLDQSKMEYYPYLTRSNTNLKNVIEILKTVKSNLEFDVYLVTRTYLSRHGDGPIFNKTDHKPYKNITEEVNVENQWQGKMRYGYFDKPWYDKAKKEIEKSLNDNHIYCVKNKPKINIALTCCDHLGNDDFMLNMNGKVQKGNINDLTDVSLKSFGKFEDDIKEKHGDKW